MNSLPAGEDLLAFADRTAVGQELRGTVEKVLPFGIIVDFEDGIAGLVSFREVHGRPAVSPVEDFEAGEEIAVVVTEIDGPTRGSPLQAAGWPAPKCRAAYVTVGAPKPLM